MSLFDLSDYRTVHSSKANLLIHLFAVPLFDLALIACGFALATGRWLLLVLAVAAMVGAMALQKIGHGSETRPPEPFTGPANFLYRWFREQLLVFPWFVLSGAWLRQWRLAAQKN